MTTEQNYLYQSVVDTIRRRHARSDSYTGVFHAEGTPAISKYPNVAAELNSSDFWINSAADYAKVTREIMAAIIEDGEDMELDELYGLCNLWQCDPDYLADHELHMIEDEDRASYVEELAELIQAVGGDVSSLSRNAVWRYEQIKSGVPCTYAAYRNAKKRLARELSRKRREKHPDYGRRRKTFSEMEAENDSIQTNEDQST